MNPQTLELYSTQELREIRDNFTAELEEAKDGTKNSLAFIKNPLPTEPLVARNEHFQVLTVGGTNAESVLVRIKDTEVHIDEHKKGKSPVFSDASTLFEFVEQNLYPDVSVVAINFAFPVAPVVRNGLLDGQLIQGVKGHDFKGLIGETVGEEIEKYVADWRGRDIKVTVANDTVCLILAGNKFTQQPETILGGIVGTGTNFGYYLDPDTIVNLESANFDKFKRKQTDKPVDAYSEHYGNHLFEKEVAGKYLFGHYNSLVTQPGVNEDDRLSSTEELSECAANGTCASPDIARGLLERSAQLIAAQIAGLYRFKNTPALTAIMEGSLFWNGHNYRENVEKYVSELGVAPDGIRFVRDERSSIVGAALLTGKGL